MVDKLDDVERALNDFEDASSFFNGFLQVVVRGDPGGLISFPTVGWVRTWCNETCDLGQVQVPVL